MNALIRDHSLTLNILKWYDFEKYIVYSKIIVIHHDFTVTIVGILPILTLGPL